MDIATILTNLMELARNSNMTFEELLAWLAKNDRNEEIEPWEE